MKSSHPKNEKDLSNMYPEKLMPKISAAVFKAKEDILTRAIVNLTMIIFAVLTTTFEST